MYTYRDKLVTERQNLIRMLQGPGIGRMKHEYEQRISTLDEKLQIVQKKLFVHQ